MRTTCVALLRAINLGSFNRVSMPDLCELLTELRLRDARSLLQSGNLVFQSDGRTPAAVERTLETAAEKRLGLSTDFFVRTAGEWEAVVARNPFPEQADRDPRLLQVMFLKDAPGHEAVAAFNEAIAGREVAHVSGREAYIVYPDGVGRSRLTTALIEKKLGTRGTARNWNTVVKLHALTSGAPRTR